MCEIKVARELLWEEKVYNEIIQNLLYPNRKGLSVSIIAYKCNYKYLAEEKLKKQPISLLWWLAKVLISLEEENQRDVELCPLT